MLHESQRFNTEFSRVLVHSLRPDSVWPLTALVSLFATFFVVSVSPSRLVIIAKRHISE